LRAPRRRSEIQRPECCLTTPEFLPDRSTTEMVDHRTHVLAMNFRLSTFQRTLPKTTDGGEKPPRSFRRNACNRLPQMQSCLAFDFCFPRRRVANNIAMSSPVNRCREKSFCDFDDRFTPAQLAGAELSASWQRVLELVYWPAIKTAGRLGSISFERDRDTSRVATSSSKCCSSKHRNGRKSPEVAYLQTDGQLYAKGWGKFKR